MRQIEVKLKIKTVWGIDSNLGQAGVCCSPDLVILVQNNVCRVSMPSSTGRPRRTDLAMGFTIEGCPAGNGQLDMPWLLEQFNASSCDYSASLELWPPPALSRRAKRAEISQN